jgi:hypothetical protein
LKACDCGFDRCRELEGVVVVVVVVVVVGVIGSSETECHPHHRNRCKLSSPSRMQPEKRRKTQRTSWRQCNTCGSRKRFQKLMKRACINTPQKQRLKHDGHTLALKKSNDQQISKASAEHPQLRWKPRDGVAATTDLFVGSVDDGEERRRGGGRGSLYTLAAPPTVTL